MADIVNLRTVRKRASRDHAAAKAAENRVTYGRSKAQRALDHAKADKIERTFEAHKITTEDSR